MHIYDQTSEQQIVNRDAAGQKLWDKKLAESNAGSEQSSANSGGMRRR